MSKTEIWGVVATVGLVLAAIVITTVAHDMGEAIKTLNSQTVPVQQVIDCWHGEQIETPNVKFTGKLPEQNFCLVIPQEGWNL